MTEKARQKMIAALNAVTGRTDCGEAVILQRRPPWLVFVLVPVFAVGMILFQRWLDLPAMFAGGIAGGLVGLVLALFTESYLLGYFDGSVVLAKSSKMKVLAVEVLAEMPYPASATVDGGMLTKKVTLAGERYLIAKMLETRFRSITGVAA